MTAFRQDGTLGDFILKVFQNKIIRNIRINLSELIEQHYGRGKR
jgi:hypothetical protein